MFIKLIKSLSITNWQAVVQQKQALVDELRQAKYADLLARYETIAYIEGQASFTATGSLEVDGQPIDAPKVIIATGAQPTVPAIPGIHLVPYLTSTTALELEQLPSSMLVIGASYIGVEIAQIFARAGVQVTTDWACSQHRLWFHSKRRNRACHTLELTTKRPGTKVS